MMMMKSGKTNKKLALLVSMALATGVVFSAAPGSVYAADYTFEYSGSSWTNGTAADFGSAIAGAGNTVTVNYSGWKDFLTAQAAAGGNVATAAGNVINVNGDTGSTQASYTINLGSGSLTVDNSSKLVLTANDVDSITFKIGADDQKRLMRMQGHIGTVRIEGSGYSGGDVGTSYIKFDPQGGELTIDRVEVSNGAFFKTLSDGVKVDTLVLESGGRVGANQDPADKTTVAVNTLVVDTSDPAKMAEELSRLEVTATASGAAPSEMRVKALNGDLSTISDELWAAIAGTVGITDPAGVENLKTNAFNAAIDEMIEGVANTDPFDPNSGKLPGADEIANMDNLTAAQKEKLVAAVQEAGRTAAAPGVTSARTAGVITNVLRDNVVNRNAEIRDFALEAAVDDGRPAPDRVWFQYKHTNMDVDGDVYDESNVNINTFQLGYDAKLGANDYLGVFVGTTTGDSEFKGPKRSGRMDIDGAFDVGVYGTHMLPAGQYIDYMIHTGSFDSKYAGDKWGTTDTGAMVGYGLKIASGDRLTMNPYVQIAYDKISVDDYITGAGGNRISSDDSDNWTAKLGMNIIDASGLYGGLAYSRGLSGSYNAYINGVPMPTSDYNANVLYLSLGYRANMSKNAVFDLSMEKTFLDYDGWTASGKLNFYF